MADKLLLITDRKSLWVMSFTTRYGGVSRRVGLRVFLLGSHQASIMEQIEVLADRGVGDLQSRCQEDGVSWPLGLQQIEDRLDGAFEVLRSSGRFRFRYIMILATNACQARNFTFNLRRN